MGDAWRRVKAKHVKKGDTIWFPTDDEVYQAAIEEVKSLLTHPDHLDRVAQFRHEYEKNQKQIEKQLSSAVRTQMDEARLGLDYLVQSVDMASTIKQDFLSIDTFCIECKALLREYGDIKHISQGGLNLAATVRLRDDFDSIADKTETLMDTLDDDDLSVKEVYRQLRLLVDLRDRAFEQSRNYSDELNTNLGEAFKSLQHLADYLEGRIWENMEDCDTLSVENKLVFLRTMEVIVMEDRAKRKMFCGLDTHKSDQRDAKTMKTRCFEHLDKMITQNFGDLIHTEEVSASSSESDNDTMEEDSRWQSDPDPETSPVQVSKTLPQKAPEQKQQPKPKKKKKKKKQNPFDDSSSSDEEEEPSDEDMPLPDEVLAADDSFHESSDEDYDMPAIPEDTPVNQPAVNLRDPAAGKSKKAKKKKKKKKKIQEKVSSEFFQETIDNLTDLVKELYVYSEFLDPLFPKDFKVMEFFEQRYKHWILVTVNFHTADPDRLERRDMLSICTWIDWYIDEIQYLFDSPSGEGIQQIVETIMNAFVYSSKQTLQKVVGNIINVEHKAGAKTNSEGYYVTSGPQDLFYTVHQQLSVILKYGLKGRGLKYVVLMLQDIFRYHQTEQIKFMDAREVVDGAVVFGEKRERRTEEFFCAIINNSKQCQKNVDGVRENIIDNIESNESKEHERANENSQRRSVNSSRVSYYDEDEDTEQTSEDVINEIEDILDDTAAGYVSVASQAVSTIVLCLMMNLQDVMSKLFTTEWLETELTEDLLNVAGEFYQKICDGLQVQAYFERVVKQSLHALMQEYVRLLTEQVKNKTSTKITLDDPRVADKLTADYKIFKEFFKEFDDMIGKKLVRYEISAIKRVYHVITGTEENIIDDFGDFKTRFGSTAPAILEGLLALRIDLKKNAKKELLSKYKNLYFVDEIDGKSSLSRNESAALTNTIASTMSEASKQSNLQNNKNSNTNKVSTGISNFFSAFKQKKMNILSSPTRKATSAGDTQTTRGGARVRASESEEEVMDLDSFLDDSD